MPGNFCSLRNQKKLFILNCSWEYLALYEVSLLGYCLMSNHVHLILLPPEADSLALAMKQTHGRYAAFWNASHRSSGHVWQGRFYSCPLDESHLWIALRYVERNPVRARLATQAQDWPWSSAAAHCGVSETPSWLAMEHFRQRWHANKWCVFLDQGETKEQLREVRRCTHTGRPLGGQAFVQGLEDITKRRLVPCKGGRPRRNGAHPSQAGWTSEMSDNFHGNVPSVPRLRLGFRIER